MDFPNIFNINQPEYMTSLLGSDAADKLRERANATGLINMAVGYLAQPKNQRLGVGRILANSYMAGQQGAQGTYDQALNDWQQAQKIKELQRQQQQQQLQEQAISKVSETNPELGNMLRAFPSAAPDVLGKLYSPAKATAKQLTEDQVQQLRTAGYKIPQGALVQADENGKLSLVEGTYQKEPSQFRVGETRTVPNASGTGEITEVYGADGKWTQRGGVKPYYKPDEPNPFLPTATKTPSSLTVKTVTMQDVQDTATASGKTVDQVKQDLAKKKIQIKG